MTDHFIIFFLTLHTIVSLLSSSLLQGLVSSVHLFSTSTVSCFYFSSRLHIMRLMIRSRHHSFVSLRLFTVVFPLSAVLSSFSYESSHWKVWNPFCLISHHVTIWTVSQFDAFVSWLCDSFAVCVIVGSSALLAYVRRITTLKSFIIPSLFLYYYFIILILFQHNSGGYSNSQH